MNQLAALGKMVERVLSNPVHIESNPIPICGDNFSGKTLLDTWREYDSEKWTVVRLEGAVYSKRIATPEERRLQIEWKSISALRPDNIKYKAVICCEIQTIEDRPLIRLYCSYMLGENIADLLQVFVGMEKTEVALLTAGKSRL